MDQEVSRMRDEEAPGFPAVLLRFIPATTDEEQLAAMLGVNRLGISFYEGEENDSRDSDCTGSSVG